MQTGDAAVTAALDVFRRNGADADAVAIDDPREHPDFAMPDH